MPRRIWLHIGSEKTGTTSIQTFLSRNRAALAERGFIVPIAAGDGNQMGLAAYALGDRVVKVLGMFGVNSIAEVPAFHARLERDLATELAMAPDAQVVFSNEHCSSRLGKIEELERLKGLCDRLADETRIVIYIRNQVEQLTSWYSTAIKTGATKDLQWPPGPVGAHMLDYEVLLNKWAQVFGHDNMVVRRFVSSDFVGGDLITDFGTAIGLNTEGLVMPPRANTSLDVACLGFLREFNRHVPRHVDGELNPRYGRIVAELEAMSQGPTLRLTAEVAADVTARYAATNAAVSRDYFGGRHDPLFPSAKTAASSDAATIEADPATVQIAARLWSANMDRIAEMEAALELCRRRLRRIKAAKLKAVAHAEAKAGVVPSAVPETAT